MAGWLLPLIAHVLHAELLIIRAGGSGWGNMIKRTRGSPGSGFSAMVHIVGVQVYGFFTGMLVEACPSWEDEIRACCCRLRGTCPASRQAGSDHVHWFFSCILSLTIIHFCSPVTVAPNIQEDHHHLYDCSSNYSSLVLRRGTSHFDNGWQL